MMGTFRSLIVLAAGAAIGGAALLAYQISRETGKPLQEAFTDIPCGPPALLEVRAKLSG